MNLAVSGSLGLYVGRFGGVASYVSRDTCAKGGEGSSSITPSHLGRQGVVAQPIIVTIRGTGWVAVGGGGIREGGSVPELLPSCTFRAGFPPIVLSCICVRLARWSLQEARQAVIQVSARESRREVQSRQAGPRALPSWEGWEPSAGEARGPPFLASGQFPPQG